MYQRLILASGSPRRHKLLLTAGISHTVLVSYIDESVIREKDPARLVSALSRLKAEAVLPKVEKASLILGADTVVALDGEILGKPQDEAEAFRMLRLISGRVHEVFTGVTLLPADPDTPSETFSVRTLVHVYPLTDAEIRAYIKSGEPMDKAGAYGIQGRFSRFISSIEGSWTSVVGLPVAEVCQHLKHFNPEILTE